VIHKYYCVIDGFRIETCIVVAVVYIVADESAIISRDCCDQRLHFLQCKFCSYHCWCICFKIVFM